MPRPLKVYRAHIGFFDSIVAAHSQKESLALWGGSPDEFRKGFASVTKDEDAVKAALANPGVVLYRPFGSKGPFSREKTLPRVKAPPHKDTHDDDAARKNAEREKARAEARQERALAKSKLDTTLRQIADEERELERRRAAARSEYAKASRSRHKKPQ